MEKKTIVFPDVDLSHDEGSPEYIAHGPDTPVTHENGHVYHRWNGLPPGHYAEYWQLCVVESWQQTVEAYETDPDDVYRAWLYIDRHPIFWEFHTVHKEYPVNHVSALTFEGAMLRGWPEIAPYMVCPETGRIEEDRSRNTKLEWWYEFGPYGMTPDENGMQVPTHDYELDGGADSYELAVVELAGKIHEHYGNDRQTGDRWS